MLYSWQLKNILLVKNILTSFGISSSLIVGVFATNPETVSIEILLFFLLIFIVVVAFEMHKDIADVEWSMVLEGGLIIFGKEKSGTVDIAAGESVNAKSFVFGIGKPTITVKAGCAEKITTGIVILIFVLGVQ